MIRDSKDNIVPDWLFFLAVAVSLALPNLIYSGVRFFQTLHLMKWTFALVPVGLLALFYGFKMALKGAESFSFKIDLFGWVWFVLVLYVSTQPMWVDVRSLPTFYREWFFLVSLWAMYVVCYHGFQDKWLTPLLWLASLNGAVNVVFAELQVANMVDIFSPLNLILPTPGNYIGNTGQQNMLGLWLAITGLGSCFIYLVHGVKNCKGWMKALASSNLIFLFVITWGLWNSTSRSAILALFVGLALMALMIAIGRDKIRLKRLSFFALLLVIVLSLSVTLNSSRSGSIISKAKDLVENADTVGGRSGIWKTSWTMYKMRPITGFGLGQFKWNYLDAQRKAFRVYPDLYWQYTNWAHNEYLQWFCETGIFGGIVLLSMALWWLISFFKYIYSKRGEPFSPSVLWSCSFLFLIWFDALWTRPFHRIENSLWLSLAFALANREIMKDSLSRSMSFINSKRGYRALGAIMAAISIWGGIYLVQGIRADMTMRDATMSRSAVVQKNLFQKASNSLMVHDIAVKQLAYHYITFAKISKNPELLAEGLNELLKVFNSEPTARELKTLIDWAAKLRKEKMLQILTSYLKPGSYKIRKSQ